MTKHFLRQWRNTVRGGGGPSKKQETFSTSSTSTGSTSSPSTGKIRRWKIATPQRLLMIWDFFCLFCLLFCAFLCFFFPFLFFPFPIPFFLSRFLSFPFPFFSELISFLVHVFVFTKSSKGLSWFRALWFWMSSYFVGLHIHLAQSKSSIHYSGIHVIFCF